MRLINVEAFRERDRLIKQGELDCHKNVLEFKDDETTEYAILSHRWTAQEVDYREMVKLAKMGVEERVRICRRDGYRKILQSCEQARANGYEWLWVDTCCIDKRSSAELSEAINSMYRWYEKAKMCYAYLHDVPGSSFPTASDWGRYGKFKGWPEWFSRGWTLQELMAPSNVEFFNKDWQSIGDKRTHAPTLRNITGIPEHILTDGLRGNRPCVAQIMSWAAHRKTTRVEDRAYSLMGLLDVNMPMLYGEGKKAFHRLQLEIIRTSNDQSIFAWKCRIGNEQPTSILADDPMLFEGCDEMELMGHDEFIKYIKTDVPKEELDSVEDRLGAFPVSNRGIQIWLVLRPYPSSRTLFQAWLPCRHGRLRPPVAINLTLWESNYYRYPVVTFGPRPEAPLELCHVYLRYQDPQHRNTTFKIDDTALAENGFTSCAVFPKRFSGDTLTLTSTEPLCVNVYLDSLTNPRFVVGLGQYFGTHWIHILSDDSELIPGRSWQDYTIQKYGDMVVSAPEHAQRMNKARSGAEQVCIMQVRLPQTNRIFQISSVMWKSVRACGVKLSVFDDPNFSDVSSEWTAFDVDVGSFFCTSQWH